MNKLAADSKIRTKDLELRVNTETTSYQKLLQNNLLGEKKLREDK